MIEKITVVFDISDRAKFEQWLQFVTADESGFIQANSAPPPIGYRAGDTVDRRESLQMFTSRMEEILRRHDHKSGWRTDPIEMLVRKLKLELAEFEIAYDFERWEEARNEAVDLANFCLIVWDRLGMSDMKP